MFQDLQSGMDNRDGEGSGPKDISNEKVFLNVSVFNPVTDSSSSELPDCIIKKMSHLRFIPKMLKAFDIRFLVSYILLTIIHPSGNNLLNL